MEKLYLCVFAMLATCSWAIIVKSHMKYKDPKQPIGVRIMDLMSRMTLEEKIGQMTHIDSYVATPEVMRTYLIGSLSIGGASPPSKEPYPEAWINTINTLQRGSLATRLGIPMMYGIDAVHGNSKVYNATIFPHNIGLGVTRDPELMKKIGAATALEVRATGINYVFAPCVAVCRDPRWGRCFESFSEDPNIVRVMTEIITGLQGDIHSKGQIGFPFVVRQKKVAACAKHYVGDGGTTRGINENNTAIDFHGLKSIHMPPYHDAIRKGVASIMVSYSSWKGVKMHRNHELIAGFLKNALKFKGFVISDFMGIDKLTDPPHADYTWSIQQSISAGLDMIMVGFNYPEFISGLTHLVKKKFIPMSRIDDAVRRILRVKFMMGLFENPFTDFSMAKYLGEQDHRDLAREAVRKSLVLLKNGKFTDVPMLPLPKTSTRILVAGTHADDIGNQCGGWTIEWHGKSGNITKGTTILAAVKNTVDPTTEVVYEEEPSPDFIRSNNFSYAIVVTGEYPYSESVGDSQTLMIPEPGPTTIMNVCGSVECVVVLITGRPVVIEPYVPIMDALVAAWLPGTEGQGVADVLFGDYGFTGKLAHTWFRTVDQLPMNVGDPNYDPLYPFGYGLTTKPVLEDGSEKYIGN
ncbi:unnamed protein product [Lactuca saligna]|uniref:Beta-glucosidase n=1 Tax=Lactuca saligna TaxID=75948 RepID=A0AA36DW93_LACSI|nr:unnamed protein product [Lactuca saligna]